MQCRHTGSASQPASFQSGRWAGDATILRTRAAIQADLNAAPMLLPVLRDFFHGLGPPPKP